MDAAAVVHRLGYFVQGTSITLPHLIDFLAYEASSAYGDVRLRYNSLTMPVTSLAAVWKVVDVASTDMSEATTSHPQWILT